MKNPKVFELIRQLSGKERMALREFAGLSLLKRSLSEKELRWLDHLLAQADEKSWQLEMEEVEKLFPGEGIDRSRINAFHNNILKAAEEFLLFQSVSMAGKHEKDWRIALRYLEIQAERNLRTTINKLHKHIEAPKELSENRFYWVACSHWLEVAVKGKERKKGQDLVDQLLLEIEAKENDFRLFILNRLYHLSNIVRVFSEKKSQSQLKQVIKSYRPVLEQIQASLPNLPPELQLHFHLLKMALGEDVPGHFQYIRALLAQQEFPFSKLLRKQALIALRNECVRFINQGELAYAQTYLELTDELIAMGEFLQGNELRPAELKNCVSHAIVCNRIDWAEHILKKYSKYLAPDVRDATAGLAKAQLLFERGMLQEALRQLNLFHSDDIFFQRAYFRILCKIYYEQEAEEAAVAKAESFLNHLKHQKQISTIARKKLQLFARMLIDLVEDKEKARRLWEKHKNDFPPTERAWIEQKVEELGRGGR